VDEALSAAGMLSSCLCSITVEAALQVSFDDVLCNVVEARGRSILSRWYSRQGHESGVGHGELDLPD